VLVEARATKTQSLYRVRPAVWVRAR